MTFVKTLERMAGATLHSMMRLAQFLDIAALVAVAPKDAHLLLRSDAHARGVRRCDREVAERKDSPRTFHTKCEPTKGGGFTVELARSKPEIPWVPPRPSSRAQATSVQEATPMPRIPR
jgi:hypothetical protein